MFDTEKKDFVKTIDYFLSEVSSKYLKLSDPNKTLTEVEKIEALVALDKSLHPKAPKSTPKAFNIYNVSFIIISRDNIFAFSSM
jgi:aspartate carbamoyltransferase regulatory subunit